jgi:polar amino acid transport system substrate-binding protein
MSKYLKHLGMALMAVVSVVLMAHEASAESTLEKILSAKKIRIAIDVANPPFGILDKSGQPDGSDVAVARQLAKDLGAEVEFVQVPPTGRTCTLAGRADVTIASISVTTDRAKAVMYCSNERALSITIFAPQSVKIKTRRTGRKARRYYARHARGGDCSKEGTGRN